jgi:hypothetical protein
VCKQRTAVHLGKFPALCRTLLCRRCNFKMYVSAANSQAGQAQVITEVKSQGHIATDGQSVGKSWCHTPSRAHVQIFITV